jgi:short-subunit dehydrogenase
MKPLDHSRQTTLITGASSGIGAEFARQLAQLGSDVVLVARRADRLEELAAALRTRHGVTATPIAADLSDDAPGTFLHEEVARRGIAITSVINNAGFGTWGRFHDENPDRLRQMIAVDVTALTDISRAFLPELRADGTGYLMNIASVAAYAPIPNQAAYSAAKAYVLSLTESLWAECHDTGLRVMAFSPGVTRTEYFDVVGSTDATGGSSYQSAEQVVSNALRVLGRRNPPPSAVSGWKNQVIASSGRLLSRRQMVSLAARNTLRDSGNH